MLSFSQKFSLEVNPYNPSECHLSLAYRNISSIPIVQIKQFLQKESAKVLADIDKRISIVEKKRKLFLQNLMSNFFRRDDWEDQDVEQVLSREKYETLKMHGLSVTVLDLSNNSFGSDNPLSKQVINLDFMKDTLHTLILDSNDLTHHFMLPQCSKLTSLSLNNNNLNHLSLFVERIRKACPNLTNLSLLKNPCCLNYFTGKQLSEERRYRLFVIGRLPRLTVLDGAKVTPEEMDEARKLYANWEEKLDLGVGKSYSSIQKSITSPQSPIHEIEQEKVRRDEPEPIAIETGSSSDEASLCITSEGNGQSESTDIQHDDDSFSTSSSDTLNEYTMQRPVKQLQNLRIQSQIPRDSVQTKHDGCQHTQKNTTSIKIPQESKPSKTSKTISHATQIIQLHPIEISSTESSQQMLDKDSEAKLPNLRKVVLPEVPNHVILPEVPTNPSFGRIGTGMVGLMNRNIASERSMGQVLSSTLSNQNNQKEVLLSSKLTNLSQAPLSIRSHISKEISQTSTQVQSHSSLALQPPKPVPTTSEPTNSNIRNIMQQNIRFPKMISDSDSDAESGSDSEW